MTIHKRLAKIQSRGPEIVFGALLTMLLVYSAARDHFDYRWSGWAFGDAQLIFASERFAEQGILTNYALPSYLPNTQFGNTAKPYLHYPQLVNVPILTGLNHLGFTDPHSLKIFHVLLNAGFLIALFYFIRTWLPPWGALLGTIYVGVSVVFLDYVDSFAHVYDEIFRICFFASIVAYARSDSDVAAASNTRRARLFLGAAFVSALLQSLNSYEYIFGLQIFGFGYLYWKKRLTVRVAAILLSAPLLGLIIHFSQVILYEGFRAFLADYQQTFLFRAYNNFSITADFIFSIFNYGMTSSYGPSITQFIILGVLFVLTACFAVKDRDTRKRVLVVAGLLLISSIAWYVTFPQSSLNFIVYTPKHLFVIVAVLFGFTGYYLAETSIGSLRNGTWTALVCSSAAIGGFASVVLVPTATNSWAYIEQFPNLVGPRTYVGGTPTNDWISDIEFCRKISSLAMPGHQLVLIETQNLHEYTTPPGLVRSPNNLLNYYCRGIIISIAGAQVLPPMLADLKQRIKSPADIFLASKNNEFLAQATKASPIALNDNWKVVRINLPE